MQYFKVTAAETGSCCGSRPPPLRPPRSDQGIIYCSVSGPYHFDADPDSDPRIRFRDDGSGSGSGSGYGSGSDLKSNKFQYFSS